MLQHGILKPVLPEIGPERLCDLEALLAAEKAAGVQPHPLRRLAALLPPDPALADRIAARLKMSNKARKRLASAVDRQLGTSPRGLAYSIGVEEAADRLLLASRAADARELADWTPPKLPISGGALISRGLPPGPAVAETLRRIEARWTEAGFPAGAAFDRIIAEELTRRG
jgi:poly(A) polymerase